MMKNVSNECKNIAFYAEQHCVSYQEFIQKEIILVQEELERIWKELNTNFKKWKTNLLSNYLN